MALVVAPEVALVVAPEVAPVVIRVVLLVN